MFRLVSQLEDRVKTVSEEISSLEGVDRRLEELQDKMSRLARQLGGVTVWDQDHANTDEKLVVRLPSVINRWRCVWYSQSVHPALFWHFENYLNPKIPVLMHRILSKTTIRCKPYSDIERKERELESDPRPDVTLVTKPVYHHWGVNPGGGQVCPVQPLLNRHQTVEI